MSEIRIVERPEVYLFGRQAVDEDELARFLADNGSPGWTTDAPSAGERLVECAGRLCYQSFAKPRPGGNAAYIEHILEVGHGSVAEHCVFTILITGISRTLSHELVRHRHLSPSQLSQRYVDSSDVAFVVPPVVADVAFTRQVWERACGAALESYQDLVYEISNDLTIEAWKAAGTPDQPGMDMDALEVDHALVWAEKGLSRDAKTSLRKAAREAARSVLPGCTETKICLTGNARAWRHLLEMRGSAGADAEFRRLALALLPVLQSAGPNLFGDYTTPTVDGVQVIETPHRKV